MSSLGQAQNHLLSIRRLVLDAFAAQKELGTCVKKQKAELPEALERLSAPGM